MRTLSLDELLIVSGGSSKNQKAIEASCKSDINTAMGFAGSSGAALGAAFGSAGGPVGAGLGAVVGGATGALGGMLAAIKHNRDCQALVEKGKASKENKAGTNYQ